MSTIVSAEPSGWEAWSEYYLSHGGTLTELPGEDNSLLLISTQEGNEITLYTNIPPTDNTKNYELYSEKTVFMVPDTDWEEILTFLSATLWVADENDMEWCNTVFEDTQSDFQYTTKCAYPLIIYHEEGQEYDLDAPLHFLDPYDAERIIHIGKCDDKLKDLLGAKRQFFGMFPPEREILETNTDQILSYWDTYSTVVFVDNEYALSMQAAQYASYKNAPLVIAFPGNSLNNWKTFADKRVVCIGTSSPSGAECSTRFNEQQLTEELISLTGSDKAIILNTEDIQEGYCEDIDFVTRNGEISQLYCHDSLAAPYLASAKEEIITTVDFSPYVGLSDFEEKRISPWRIAAAGKNLFVFDDLTGDIVTMRIADDGFLETTEYASPVTLRSDLELGGLFSFTAKGDKIYVLRNEKKQNDESIDILDIHYIMPDGRVSKGVVQSTVVSSSDEGILNIAFGKGGVYLQYPKGVKFYSLTDAGLIDKLTQNYKGDFNFTTGIAFSDNKLYLGQIKAHKLKEKSKGEIIVLSLAPDGKIIDVTQAYDLSQMTDEENSDVGNPIYIGRMEITKGELYTLAFYMQSYFLETYLLSEDGLVLEYGSEFDTSDGGDPKDFVIWDSFIYLPIQRPDLVMVFDLLDLETRYYFENPSYDADYISDLKEAVEDKFTSTEIPNYYTYIASPKAIPFSIRPSLNINDLYSADVIATKLITQQDESIGIADIPTTPYGRIFGVSVSDTSSYVARSVFSRDIAPSSMPMLALLVGENVPITPHPTDAIIKAYNQDKLIGIQCYMEYSSTLPTLGVLVEIPDEEYAKLNQHEKQYYVSESEAKSLEFKESGNVELPCSPYPPSLESFDDFDIIFSSVHGNSRSWAFYTGEDDPAILTSNEVLSFDIDPSIILADSCANMDYYRNYDGYGESHKPTLANSFIRAGSMGYLGFVTPSGDAAYSGGFKIPLESILLDEEPIGKMITVPLAGSSREEYLSNTYETYFNNLHPRTLQQIFEPTTTLLGDPTYKPVLNYGPTS